MILSSKKKSEGGFAIVEMLVGGFIIVAMAIGVATAVQKSVEVSRLALRDAQSAYLLEEGAEAIRTLRASSWSNIASSTAGTNYYFSFSTSTNLWSLTTSTTTVGIFSRKVVLSDVYRDGADNIATSGALDASSRRADITVSYPNNTATISKQLSFYIFNL